MKKRNYFSLGLALIIMLTFISGCTPQTGGTSEPDQQPQVNAPSSQGKGTPFTPGTYTGKSIGFGGPMTVEVEVSEDQILRVTVGENEESVNIGDLAFPILEKNIVENQSLADIVSGATFSSSAVIGAVIDALKAADASDDTIKQIRSNPIDVGLKPEDTETDIVVVGAGAAGMVAAMSAHDSGSKVILLEKLDTVGGSTKLSAGAMWSLGVEQIEAVYAYTADEVYEYFSRWAGPVYSREVFYSVVNGSSDSMNYVLQNNLELLNFAIPSQPKEDARFNSVIAVESGGGLIAAFYKDIVERNIDLRLNSPAIELVQEASGAITGVVVETPAGKYTIKAKKIILATGGFTFNKEMLAQYAPNTYDHNVYSSAVGGTGDGHRLGLAAGGEMIGEGILGIHAVDTKPGSDVTLTHSIPLLVNKKGEQIAATDEHYTTVQKKITAQEDGLAYAIYDSDYDESGIETLEQLIAEGYAYKANSLDELAALLNIDASGLKTSVESLNKHYDAGTDDDLGAAHAFLIPIKTGPFYGYRRSAAVMGTIAGLKVDEHMQVLNTQGEPIENLYAAGELMFGNLFNNIYPMSGTAIGMSISSGRIAALHAHNTLRE